MRGANVDAFGAAPMREETGRSGREMRDTRGERMRMEGNGIRGMVVDVRTRKRKLKTKTKLVVVERKSHAVRPLGEKIGTQR